MATGQFFDQFIDDFYSEAEQHLAGIRRVLLAIESRHGTFPGREESAGLARSLHTLKGLSGMVGLLDAEQVAHAMEDACRAADRALDVWDADLVEELFNGVALLERCINAKRERATPPDVEPFVRRVHEVILATNPPLGQTALDPSNRVESTSIATVRPVSVPQSSPGAGVRRFEFTPSADAAGRGIGVESVRARLQSLGTIVRAAPLVRDGGGVMFEFVVAVASADEPDPAWKADGLSWGPLAATEPAAIARAASGSARVTTSSEQSALPVTAGANMVRVDLARLDDLMRMVGEMVVLRSRLDEALAQANGNESNGVLDEVRETNEAMERQLRTLREGVMRIRLVPVGEVFERMRFAMRDIARETGKVIQLEVRGQDTEIDKLVVDRMLEPLLHLVRNAASHGIEPRAERVARGKPDEGRISLRARAAGDRIVIEVEDDGAGIDTARVAERAEQLGLDAHTGAEDLRDNALLDVLCAPGFSTRESADLASGRGVGMAVVRSAIRGVGGELSVRSVPGSGTCFMIELPLTLMITDALLVRVGDQTMAVPQISLREILQLDEETVTRLENNEVISYRGGVLPLVRLRRLFGLAAPADIRPHILVVGGDTQLVGLVVDRLVGLREIVIHPVSDPLVSVPGVSGATELADGRVSLILDVAALVRRAREHAVRSQATLSFAAAASIPAHTY